jgi:hypothetical protein
VSRNLEGRWGSGRVNVHEGTADVEVRLSVPAAAAAGPGRARVRAVFQVCRDAAAVCERSQGVALDAAYEVVPGP